MYGSPGSTTSSLPLAGMNSVKRRIEFPHHLAERCLKRRAPADQHVIVAGMQTSDGGTPDQFAQAAPHPVTLHGIANLPRHCEAHPHRALVCAPARLQHERTAGRPHAAGGSPKVRPALQPLHGKAKLGKI
jgi:hypothetical protein